MSELAWVIFSGVLGVLLSSATLLAAFCGIAADSPAGFERTASLQARQSEAPDRQ